MLSLAAHSFPLASRDCWVKKPKSKACFAFWDAWKKIKHGRWVLISGNLFQTKMLANANIFSPSLPLLSLSLLNYRKGKMLFLAEESNFYAFEKLENLSSAPHRISVCIRSLFTWARRKHTAPVLNSESSLVLRLILRVTESFEQKFTLRPCLNGLSL